MSDVNSVCVSGRLTADPKVGMGKVKYAFYSIAINKQFNESKKTTYVNIAAFGSEADYAEASLKKGKKVQVQGELGTDKQGKLMVVANEQAVKDNVLYKRNQETAPREESTKPEVEYKPFTDVSNDGSFTPIYSGEDDIPF